MEKAKVQIIKTKKGKLQIKLIFEDNKEMSIPQADNLVFSEIDGKEVEVKREKGQIKEIFYNGKKIYHSAGPTLNRQPSSTGSTGRNSSGSISHLYSKAPYNFIPLNDKVIMIDDLPDFDRYHEDRYTGYIELEIKTLTPLYIRDTLDEGEYREYIEKKQKGEQYINSDFFSPGGVLRIPGSSLRGMVRTLVEIVGYGKFSFFEGERKFHFRSFADKSLDLRRKYQQKIIGVNEKNEFYPKVKAGYLVKEGLDYYIIPAKNEFGTQFFRIEEEDAAKVFGDRVRMKFKSENNSSKPGHKDKEKGEYKKNTYYKIGFEKIKFIPVKPDVHKHTEAKLIYAKVTNIWKKDDPQTPKNAIDGVLVLSGWIGNIREGKHLHWIIGPKDEENKKIKLPENVLEDYRNDRLRDEKTNLLQYFENKKGTDRIEVPCFYIEENGEIISFGHTGFFRLAYEKKLKELLPNSLKDSLEKEDEFDLAEAIFGKETRFATRVFFEDAYLAENQEDVLLPKAYPKILSGPKPTCFQHYLEQKNYEYEYDRDSGNVRCVRGLKNYNDNACLRGYKLYWHREANEWQEKDNENIKKHKSQYTEITPVKPGVIFKSRIRFENLSDIELGALLFVLDLPEGCAHKLGMGKPLGLGSIEIKPSLYLSDRRQRYKNVFAEWEGLDLKDDEFVKELKEKFEKFVMQKLGNNSDKKSLWDIDRMKELRQMLDYRDKPANEKIEYLKLSDFRSRKVLPRPTEVKRR